MHDIVLLQFSNDIASKYFLSQNCAGRRDFRSPASPMLKIVLPKSLDGDSASGVVIPTPPVLSTAEALFNDAIERPTVWPPASCFSLRGAGTVSLHIYSGVLWCIVS